MTNNRYVARSTAIASRALGNETMVMSATNSTLFTLDEVASVIWEAADGVTPLDAIVANRICTQYDISLEVAMKDAEALVEDLAGHGILLLSDQPLPQSSSSRKENR
jgi:Coenzyme PQQ synthesis protein D (PqqD)